MLVRGATWLVLTLVWSTAAVAQTTDVNPWYVRGGFTPAFILPTNPFPANSPSEQINKAPSVTLEVGRRTDGSSKWHKLYGMPSYGFGFSLTSFRNGIERSEEHTS